MTQRSVNYLRAYNEIHALVLRRPGAVSRSAFVARRTLPGHANTPSVLARSPVGARRGRNDPGYPKPFSDASFCIFALTLLPPPLRFSLPPLFFIIPKNVRGQKVQDSKGVRQSVKPSVVVVGFLILSWQRV